MWTKDWRDKIWAKLDQPWDILIIGGGITGAGILREATRAGLKALLVEQRDFAWGTSSRSSKLVHGGLRYLQEGKVSLTHASVRERQRLIAAGAGLIDPLGFLLATYKGDFPGKLTYRAGLTVYDLLALQWSHTRYSPEDFQLLAPHIVADGLEGGFRYGDAQTDDARLVLRVILEAVADGGTALNYTRAESLLRDDGQVVGAVVHDAVQERRADVRAQVVINATGAWADELREQVGAPPRIRPLRGSHLIFPAWRLPVGQALSFLHPLDRRPVFIFPWEGITLVGTTDLDHEQPLNEEPHITPEEVAYLMAAVEGQCPRLHLTADDISGTFAGVRPVIGSGKANPSKESRDHVVWNEAGLLTVTGGKLTTFRLIALDALKAIHHRFPAMPELKGDVPVLDKVDVPLPGAEALDLAQRRRLLGRYGIQAPALVRAAHPGELTPVPGTPTLWAELRWAARAEGVIHLDDLLLRRTRLGLLLPEGGAPLLDDIRRICQPELGWDDARWDAEDAAYRDLWRRAYSLPDKAAIPDWKAAVAQAKAARAIAIPRRQRRIVAGTGLAAGLLGLATVLILVYFRRCKISPTSWLSTAEPKVSAR
ncbi:MAG TPA: glycerol-3-phosphate dehydrogenase/oxidase [Anaerolineae bacterium]|nr:glycerol-3-phosphate dehydrogenase/oxidase [Anaerolineae bacterium]HQH37109.1 glycerol-3-phosphate dehydrogenase/oxidase [Anaerolineae bacterium]